MRKLSLFLVLVFLSCSKPESQISDFKLINEKYVSAWLVNDSSTILSLFEQNATLAPSGMKPLKGLDKIANFWFPNDSSITTIHTFTSEIMDTQLDSTLAFTTQKTFLSWSYEKGDTKMARDQRGLAMTIYRKQADGTWKIMHQMWKDIEVIDK